MSGIENRRQPAWLDHRRLRVGGGLPLLLILVCLASASIGRADEPPAKFKEMPVNPPAYRGWNKALHYPDTANVKLMLRGNVNLNVNQFDAFFNEVLLPQFTLAENIMVTDPQSK